MINVNVSILQLKTQFLSTMILSFPSLIVFRHQILRMLKSCLCFCFRVLMGFLYLSLYDVQGVKLISSLMK